MCPQETDVSPSDPCQSGSVSARMRSVLSDKVTIDTELFIDLLVACRERRRTESNLLLQQRLKFVISLASRRKKSSVVSQSLGFVVFTFNIPDGTRKEDLLSIKFSRVATLYYHTIGECTFSPFLKRWTVKWRKKVNVHREIVASSERERDRLQPTLPMFPCSNISYCQYCVAVNKRQEREKSLCSIMMRLVD